MGDNELTPDLDLAIDMIQMANGSLNGKTGAAPVGGGSVGTRAPVLDPKKTLPSAADPSAAPVAVSGATPDATPDVPDAAPANKSRVVLSSDVMVEASSVVAAAARNLPAKLPGGDSSRPPSLMTEDRRLVRVLANVVGKSTANKVMRVVKKKMREITKVSREIQDATQDSAEVLRALQRSALDLRHAKERLLQIEKLVASSKLAFEEKRREANRYSELLRELKQKRGRLHKGIQQYRRLMQSTIDEAGAGDLPEDASGARKKRKRLSSYSESDNGGSNTSNGGSSSDESDNEHSSEPALLVYRAHRKWPTWVYRVTDDQRDTLASMTDCASCLFSYGVAHKNDEGCKKAQAFRKRIKSDIVKRMHKEQRHRLMKEYEKARGTKKQKVQKSDSVAAAASSSKRASV